MKKLFSLMMVIALSFLVVGCGDQGDETVVNNYTDTNKSENIDGFKVVQDSVLFAKFSQTIDGIDKMECIQRFGKNETIDSNSFEGFLLINGDIADNAVPNNSGHGGVDGKEFEFYLSEAQKQHRLACASDYYSEGEHLRVRSRDYNHPDKKSDTAEDSTSDSNTSDNNTSN